MVKKTDTEGKKKRESKRGKENEGKKKKVRKRGKEKEVEEGEKKRKK